VTDITLERWRAARRPGRDPAYRRPMVFTEIAPDRRGQTMSTKIAALPIERRYLLRAWIVVSAVVIAATVVIAMSVTARNAAPAGSTMRTDTTGRMVDYGPVTTSNGPIVFDDGTVCAQCR
jgi:hypothetical protein